MSDQTTIEWTDATFNPWWGCTKVSPGCDHCYAERDAKRFQPGTALWGDGSTRRTFGEAHWRQPLTWNDRARRAGKPMRVFCASMADVFDKDAPEAERARLWDVIDRTTDLRWQLLTKRIGNVERFIPPHWVNNWPAHVWLGATVVNQDEADRDVPKLLAVRGAAVRFLSCEPLLGPIDLRLPPTNMMSGFARSPRLGWVIAGGESGPKARPMHPDWVRSLRDQCIDGDVPFLFKQWGEWLWPDGETLLRVGKKAAGRELDGHTWDGFPAEQQPKDRPELF